MQHSNGKEISLHSKPISVQMVSGLEEVTAKLRQKEFEAAYRQGLEDGLRQAREQGVQAVEATLEQLDTAAERAQAELSQASVELAIEITSLLVGMRISTGEYDLESIVRGALADSGVGRGACVVHLNPEDHAALAETQFGSGTTLDIDPNLPKGDVHLTTPRGMLVREMEATLTSIREQLLEEVVR